MAIEIFDPLSESFGVHDLIGYVFQHDKIVSCAEHLIRDCEIESKLLVCQNDMIGLVHDKDAVDGRFRLGLEQRSVEQQRLLSLFALRDIAKRSNKASLFRTVG